MRKTLFGYFSNLRRVVIRAFFVILDARVHGVPIPIESIRRPVIALVLARERGEHLRFRFTA